MSAAITDHGLNDRYLSIRVRLRSGHERAEHTLTTAAASVAADLERHGLHGEVTAFDIDGDSTWPGGFTVGCGLEEPDDDEDTAEPTDQTGG